jgi:hypothetical protein
MCVVFLRIGSSLQTAAMSVQGTRSATMLVAVDLVLCDVPEPFLLYLDLEWLHRFFFSLFSSSFFFHFQFLLIPLSNWDCVHQTLSWDIHSHEAIDMAIVSHQATSTFHISARFTPAVQVTHTAAYQDLWAGKQALSSMPFDSRPALSGSFFRYQSCGCPLKQQCHGAWILGYSVAGEVMPAAQSPTESVERLWVVNVFARGLFHVAAQKDSESEVRSSDHPLSEKTCCITYP